MALNSSDVVEGCLVTDNQGTPCPNELTGGVVRVFIANAVDIQNWSLNGDGSIKDVSYSQGGRKFFHIFVYPDSSLLNVTPNLTVGGSRSTNQVVTLKIASNLNQADLNQLDHLVRSTGYIFLIVEAFGVINATLPNNNPESQLYLFGYKNGGNLTAADGFIPAGKADSVGPTLTFTSTTTGYPKVITPDPSNYAAPDPNYNFIAQNLT